MSKKIISLLLVMLMLLSMTSVLAEDTSITITDMFGREVTLTEPVTRIVALEPSDCEILCAIGCEDALVGRGKYCDYPASILELPVVQSGANTNIEEILALKPQVVLMSDMAHTQEQIAQLEANGVKVVVSDADNIEGVYTAIRMIGALMGRDTEAEAVIADMQATFDEIAMLSGVMPAEGEAAEGTVSPDETAEPKKTIYFEVMPLEWGLWSAGTDTFMHELAYLCGMENAFADIEGWQAVSEEQVIERNPDYIVLVTGMGETAVEEVMGRTGWEDITAIKNGEVYNADSYAMTRPGPRLKDAAISLYNFLNDIVVEEAVDAADAQTTDAAAAE